MKCEKLRIFCIVAYCLFECCLSYNQVFESKPLTHSSEDGRLETLVVAKELVGATLTFDEEGIGYFRIGALAASTSYEVRISHLSTQPTSYSMTLLGSDDTAFEKYPKLRNLLDTERIVVQTDSTGQVKLGTRALPVSSVLLQVKAVRSGVRPSHVRESDVDEVMFNIVIEPLLVGILPFRALKMVLWGIFCLGVAFAGVPIMSRLLSDISKEKDC